jgi:hypothetical protein
MDMEDEFIGFNSAPTAVDQADGDDAMEEKREEPLPPWVTSLDRVKRVYNQDDFIAG